MAIFLLVTWSPLVLGFGNDWQNWLRGFPLATNFSIPYNSDDIGETGQCNRLTMGLLFDPLTCFLLSPQIPTTAWQHCGCLQTDMWFLLMWFAVLFSAHKCMNILGQLSILVAQAGSSGQMAQSFTSTQETSPSPKANELAGFPSHSLYQCHCKKSAPSQGAECCSPSAPFLLLSTVAVTKHRFSTLQIWDWLSSP